MEDKNYITREEFLAYKGVIDKTLEVHHRQYEVERGRSSQSLSLGMSLMSFLAGTVYVTSGNYLGEHLGKAGEILEQQPKIYLVGPALGSILVISGFAFAAKYVVGLLDKRKKRKEIEKLEQDIRNIKSSTQYRDLGELVAEGQNFS